MSNVKLIFGGGQDEKRSAEDVACRPSRIVDFADEERVRRIIESEDDSHLWLDVRSVSLYLQISKWSVYRRIHEGVIPAVRLGGTYRVNKRALDLAIAEMDRR